MVKDNVKYKNEYILGCREKRVTLIKVPTLRNPFIYIWIIFPVCYVNIPQKIIKLFNQR